MLVEPAFGAYRLPGCFLDRNDNMNLGMPIHRGRRGGQGVGMSTSDDDIHSIWFSWGASAIHTQSRQSSVKVDQMKRAPRFERKRQFVGLLHVPGEYRCGANSVYRYNGHNITVHTSSHNMKPYRCTCTLFRTILPHNVQNIEHLEHPRCQPNNRE